MRTSCVLALCAHVAPSMYVAALRTFARPCCVLGVLGQFCRRTYLDGESARTTPPTAPAFSSGVSPRVRPYLARSHLVRLRLVRLRPARSRPVRPNPHDAIAHVCIVRARAMRVLVACVCALRAGALCLCRDLSMYTLLSLVPLAAVANIALFDDIVRLGVDTSTWLIANYSMCGIGDGA